MGGYKNMYNPENNSEMYYKQHVEPIYDQLCRILTDYENNMEYTSKDFYADIVTIVNEIQENLN